MKVTRAALAKKLNVTRQRVHTMVQEGLVVPDEKGLIDLDDALTAIAANRDPAKGGKQVPVEGTFHEHRTRKEAALARLREIEAEEKEQTLVNAEDVRRELAKAFTNVKTRLRSIPTKAAGEVYHIALNAQSEREGKAEIFKKILGEIDDALLELSQWRPESSNTNKGEDNEKTDFFGVHEKHGFTNRAF